jgi:hypothetical protein
MKTFEVVIEKTSVIKVEALDKWGAYDEAKAILHGNRGYCEYQGDGWEILEDCIEEVIK